MNKIPSISFQSANKASNIEFLSITNLFLRIDKNLDHNPKRPHRIRFFALLIVTNGSGSHQIDMKKYPLKKGSVLKIAKDQVHAFEEDLSYEGDLVVFTEDFVLKYFSNSSIDFISHLYNYHISEPLVENCCYNEAFLEQTMMELKNENSYAQKNIVAKLLELYLLQLERLSQNQVSEKHNQAHYTLFYQFKHLVEKRFSESRNVKDYASIMAISTKHLNFVVQLFTRNTAKNFIDQYVVLEIKRSILSTSHSLKEIAFEVGFDEVTNFTKYFKKHTKMTPKRFKSSL